MRENHFQEQAHQEIDRIFRTLFPKYGMTIREEQLLLCHQMLSALWDGQIALCDAAVGVGKTYAYLTASLLFRKYSGMLNGNYCMSQDSWPIVISTSSIVLQDALLGEYIPQLSEILVTSGVLKQPIRAVLRKGKEHFVCEDRLNLRIAAVQEKRKNVRQKEALDRLLQTFDLDTASNLSSFDRRMVCVPKRCPTECSMRDQCRYQNFVRQAVEVEYDIQICNHNYFLADAIHRSSGYRPLLKNYQALIIDEAHKLPETAQQMYGKRLGKEDIAEICTLLEQEKYTLTAAKLRESFRQLFTVLVPEDRDRDQEKYRAGREQERISFQPDVSVRRMLKNCVRLLKKTEDTTTGKIPRWVSNLLGESREILLLFFSMNPNRVLFLEFDRKGNPALCAIHRRLAERLERDIWDQGVPAILTSGTLVAGGSFRRVRQVSGLAACSRVREYTAASPFQYEKNVLLYLPYVENHRRNGIKGDRAGKQKVLKEQERIRKIAGQIRKLIESTNGHTLVLFTSYTMMGNVYRELKGKVSVPILRVWKDSQRVIREFKEHKNAVLFAAGSCWEGMDFPGDMVSSLIIVRLPFPVPDPVREAERERYQSLQEYIRQIVVPDMQLKLRQGFGRAIRTETDTCVVSILDSRAARGRRYHEAVLEALPRCQMTEDIGDVERFIREKKGIDYYM